MMVQFDVKRVQKGTESFMVSFDFTKTPITQIVDYIIISASKHNSSDIHFDPRGNGMMVRFRIDGDLQDYTYVPKAYERNLTTRLKLLANMNITESRLPQDGAIKGNFGDQYLDMRVSALPLNEGEKIVVRILDYSRSLNGVETLGFHPKNLEKIKKWKIRDLLTHTTGYESQMMSERFIKDIDEDKLLDYALNYDIPYDVGIRFAYNNVEPFVLSVVFQETFGINLADFINENIFKKIRY